MNRRGLQALAKLRRNAVEEAERQLIACLQAEASAEREAQAAERAISREMDAASCISADDAMAEAFAAWLPDARRRAASARLTVEQWQSEAARLRATRAACRTALETVETLQREHLADAARELTRRMQRELDEMKPLGADATGSGID